jgi:hypothetical protein
MANEKDSPGGPADPLRRRRVPPPTIDLQATDVSRPADPNPDPTPSDPPGAAPEPVESMSPEPLSSEATSGRSDEPPAAPPPPADEAPSARSTFLRFMPSRPQLAAGAVGAVLAFIIAAGIWALLGAGGPGNSAKTPDDLAQRLARIEATLADPRAPVADPALANRLAETQIKPLADGLASLARRTDDTMAAAREARERADAAAKSLADVAQQLAQLNAERARTPAVERRDLDALAARLASLETTTKSLADQLAKTAKATANAAAAGDMRQAVVAIALDAALARGAPYGRELAAIDPSIAGPGALDALAPFANTGIPSAATLARELAALMPEARKAADVPAREGGFLDRLQANAERLVRVRPIAQQPGDEPPAILGRLDAKAAQGDIAGALAEAAKLPATVRAPLEPWIRRAEARNAALAAASALAARTFELVGRPAQQGASER